MSRAKNMDAPKTALAVEYRDPAGLIPAERNARTHSPAQVEQIARSIREFGWTNPILVDEASRVIAGHGRLAAAQSLGMDRVPTIALAGLSEAQRRALVIADNKLALNAGWDMEILALELDGLRSDGFEIDLTGFTDLDLDSMLAPPNDVAAEWQGMPEFDQKDQTAHASIRVNFASAADVVAFSTLIGHNIVGRTRSIWFPWQEHENFMDRRYVAGNEP